MVEIIKKGNLPEQKEYSTVCGNCGTLFRFKRFEAVLNSSYQGDTLKILCPLEGCKKTCYVSAEEHKPPKYNFGNQWDR